MDISSDKKVFFFGLFFNGMSTSLGYLMLNPSFEKDNCSII